MLSLGETASRGRTLCNADITSVYSHVDIQWIGGGRNAGLNRYKHKLRPGQKKEISSSISDKYEGCNSIEFIHLCSKYSRQTLNVVRSDRTVSDSVAACFGLSLRDEWYQISLSMQAYTIGQYKNLKRKPKKCNAKIYFKRKCLNPLNTRRRPLYLKAQFIRAVNTFHLL